VIKNRIEKLTLENESISKQRRTYARKKKNIIRCDIRQSNYTYSSIVIIIIFRSEILCLLSLRYLALVFQEVWQA
jgi:hypothetical protein